MKALVLVLSRRGRRLTGIAIAALALLVGGSAALAGGNDYALSVSPQSQVVSPGESATMDWRAWTTIDAPVSCVVSIQELGATLFDGLIQPGTTVGAKLSVAVPDRNSRYTFALTCDGSLVSKRAVNVRIR
jgi:hypothetical protein